MGATSADVKVANLQGQIDGMDKGRAQSMQQSNFFNQNSSFMSGFSGAFMGGCCANLMNCFRSMGMGGMGGMGMGGMGMGMGGFGGFGRYGW